MSNNLDIKIEFHADNLYGIQSNLGEVKFNGMRLFSWIQTDESFETDTREFTAIGQFGYEQWFVWSPEGKWVPQFVDGVESACMTVPFSRIFAESDLAVRDTFGDALDLTYVPAVDCDPGDFDIQLDGRNVLFWGESIDWEGNYNILDAEAKYGFTRFSTSTHGFVPYNEGDCKWDISAYGAQYMEKVAPYAYRALKMGWIMEDSE